MRKITVIKRNLQGEATWQYEGVELERGGNFVRLEALFNRDDMPFQGTVLKRGDRFVEMFYTDHWYNIFAIHDRDDGALKGYYCNIGKPAVWDTPDTISYVDLALDLWVTPDGKQVVLDEDEFAESEFPPELEHAARAALAELQDLFKNEQPPV